MAEEQPIIVVTELKNSTTNITTSSAVSLLPTTYTTTVIQASPVGAAVSGPQGIQGLTGATGPTGPSGNELANDILEETTVARVDAMLNLGLYYPKYTSTLTQTELNSRFAASSYLF